MVPSSVVEKMKLAVYLILAIFAVLAVSLNAEDNEATVDDFENEAGNPIEDEDDDDDDLDEDEPARPKKSPWWWSRRRRRRTPAIRPEIRCKAPRRQGNRLCSMDGCSVKWAPFVHVNFWFRSACNEHDCCYQFKTCSRADCDKAFKNNMLKKCGGNGLCKFHAYTYYYSVRAFGGGSYGKVYGK